MMARYFVLFRLAATAVAVSERVELHVHLDGSITPPTLLEVARRRALVLPALGRVPRTVADVWAALDAAPTPWARFDLVCDIVGGDAAALSLAAERFVARQAAQRVAYTEVRYDPIRFAVSHYANTSIGADAAVAAVTAGLARGVARANADGAESRARAAPPPRVRVYSLLCAMRGQPAAACARVAALAARARSAAPGGVVGLDLAGDEATYGNDEYVACVRDAKLVLGLNTTVHAGEAVRPDDVRSAVEEMRVDRVGHAYAAAGNASLVALLRRSGVHVEACPPGAASKGVLDAIGAFARAGLSFGLNEDDPAPQFANCSMASAEALVRDELGLTDDDIAAAYASARAAAFGPTE